MQWVAHIFAPKPPYGRLSHDGRPLAKEPTHGTAYTRCTDRHAAGGSRPKNAGAAARPRCPRACEGRKTARRTCHTSRARGSDPAVRARLMATGVHELDRGAYPLERS